MRFTRSMRLGPYEIAACIGGGGMGEVYRAWDTRLERNVAVKVLAERLASDPPALARFQVEAKAIANLSHPNILSLYDAELEHPPLYLVTELLEGETLRRRLQQSSVPWRLALPVASAIADGLAAAHEASVIHRDLKPENIFLARRGVVKILDFGLARFRPLLQEDCDQVITVTLAGSFVGTVGYLAPEQGGLCWHRRAQTISCPKMSIASPADACQPGLVSGTTSDENCAARLTKY